MAEFEDPDGRYDVEDIADDDVANLKDQEVRNALYRVTEKIKLILRDHESAIYGYNAVEGAATNPPGTPDDGTVVPGDPGAGGGTTIVIIDGVPMFEDTTRTSKVLSLARPVYSAGHYGNAAKQMYMKVSGMIPTMGPSGAYMPRDGTITGAWARSKSALSWVFEVRKNGVSLSVESFFVTGGKGKMTNLNIDFSADDYLQFYVNGEADFPQGWIEIAWRSP